MRRFLIIVGAAGLLTGNANPVDDSAIVRDYFSQYSTDNDRRALRQLAFCIADRYPEQARGAIRQQATTTAFKKRFPGLLDFSCLKSAFFKTKSATLFDGYYQQLIAERLLLADFGGGDLPSVSDVPSLDHPHLPEIEKDKIPEQFLPEFELSWATHRYALVADCTARAAPEDTFALARTAPESGQEKAALDKLRGAIERCGIGPAAQNIPVYIWRGMLVENLYRLIDSAKSHAGKTNA